MRSGRGRVVAEHVGERREMNTEEKGETKDNLKRACAGKELRGARMHRARGTGQTPRRRARTSCRRALLGVLMIFCCAGLPGVVR